MPENDAPYSYYEPDEMFDVINSMVREDPMGTLYKISRFEEPTCNWSIQEVAYALRELYDVLSAADVSIEFVDSE